MCVPDVPRTWAGWRKRARPPLRALATTSREGAAVVDSVRTGSGCRGGERGLHGSAAE